MDDWNIVVCARGDKYAFVQDFLSAFGSIKPSAYFNVMLMKVPEVRTFMDELLVAWKETPVLAQGLSRVVPVTQSFTYQGPAEFESKAKKCVAKWLPALANKSFYVRMRRRGFKGRLSSQLEERFLDQFLLSSLDESGDTAKIDFDNPDLVIAVETVGQWAGLSIWSQQELKHYVFLHIK